MRGRQQRKCKRLGVLSLMFDAGCQVLEGHLLQCGCVQRDVVGFTSFVVTLMTLWARSALRAPGLDSDIKDRRPRPRRWLHKGLPAWLELELCRARILKLAAFRFDFRHHGQLFKRPKEVKAPLRFQNMLSHQVSKTQGY
jgi:hypothetical protein